MNIEQLFSDQTYLEEMNTVGAALPKGLALASTNVGVGFDAAEIPKLHITTSSTSQVVGNFATAELSRDADGSPVLSVSTSVLSAHAHHLRSILKVTPLNEVQERSLADYVVMNSMLHIVIHSLVGLDELTMGAIQVEFISLFFNPDTPIDL